MPHCILVWKKLTQNHIPSFPSLYKVFEKDVTSEAFIPGRTRFICFVIITSVKTLLIMLRYEIYATGLVKPDNYDI